nr:MULTISPECIES: endo-1,4-beta-xylanase [unclassified Clostridium]
MSAILSSKKSGSNITALVLWGLSDDHSWCSKDEPLLYSNSPTPKEAYNSVLKVYFDAGYTMN